MERPPLERRALLSWGDGVTNAPIPVARVEGFSCWFRNAKAPTLMDIDLTLEARSLTLLLGASGSGKTTLALALNGIIPHVLPARTRGKVFIDGLDTSTHSVAELATHVGVIFQDPDSQFVTLYVRDEVAFGPENLRLDRAEIRARLASASAFVGVGDWERRYVYELSGGQKQRVNLASLLAMRPRLLVLDEPAANLDPKTATEVWNFIAGLRDQGLTILVIENRLEDLDPRVDRLLVMDAGRLRFDGAPRQVLDEHGEEIMDELGLWVPQCCELELLLRRERARRTGSLPVTVAEALKAYEHYEFARSSQPTVDTPGPEIAGPILETRGASYSYPTGTVALRNVSLAIRPGELVAIVGPNGSGKTTLVKQFLGLLKPTSGQVLAFGRDTREARVRDLASRIGLVFQFPEHQFVKDTVEAELVFSLRASGTPEAEIAGRVREVLSRFDLVGLEQRHPFSLSGGQKRRLSVAAVVITRPKVLVLDEPTYCQDRRNTMQMMRTIVDLLGGEAERNSLSIVLVTHDMRLVADYAHRAVVMRQGEIAFDGSVSAMFADPELLASANLELPSALELIYGLRARGQLDPSVISLAGLVRAVV